MYLQGVMLVLCFYSANFNSGVTGFAVESPRDCQKRAVAQDHSHNYIRPLTSTPNFDERPAVASWLRAILSEPISLLKRSVTRLVGSRSEEASESSGDSTAAGRCLDSNTARKGNAVRLQSSIRPRFRSTAAAFWKVVEQQDPPKRALNERDVDSQIMRFRGSVDVQPPITNDRLSAFQHPQVPANDHSDLPSTVGGSLSIAGDAPVSSLTFTPPPAYMADTTTATSFHPPSNACKQCWIFYPWAHVYYPPAETSNTECLTALTAAPTPNLPPLGLEPQPGYAYVVLPTLSAEINCKPFTTYTSQTFSFAPHQLSTMSGPQNLTREFNFGDLPCPPPEIASEVQWFYNPEYNPTRRYSPFLAPFTEIWDLDSAFKSYPCTVALNQGMDPPIPLAPASTPTLPKGRPRPARLARHRRDALEGAHRVPSLPVETNPPLSERA